MQRRYLCIFIIVILLCSVSGIVSGEPAAQFIGTPGSGKVPLTVQFTDTSSGTAITAWNWSFGDGIWFNTTVAAQKNPTHVFSIAGIYTARLTVCNAEGCNSTIPGQTITVAPSGGPVARISKNVSGGFAPLYVKFGDQSTGIGINQRNWSFGDGTWFNTTVAAPQVTHLFAQAGVYNVRLTVCNASGCNTTIPGTTITATGGPVAKFAKNATTGSAPLSVQFTDQSTGTGLNRWNWSFGDGTWFNTTFAAQKSPSHVYNAAGVYGVRLTVCNTTGCNTTDPGQTITVTGPDGPVAKFAKNATTGSAPLSVQFTDQSTGTGLNQWNWSFGDGIWFNTTVAAQKNPTHVYNVAGVYTTHLTVCTEAECNTTIPGQTITVVLSGGPVARISKNVSSGFAPLHVKFGDQSTGTGINQRNWSFGDGTWFNTTVAAPQVTHLFAQAGVYNVRLTVCNASGCNTTIPGTTITAKAPAKPLGKFTTNVTSGTAPLTVKFTDQSTGIAPFELCLGL